MASEGSSDVNSPLSLRLQSPYPPPPPPPPFPGRLRREDMLRRRLVMRQLPWIVPMREQRRDDVRVAWEEGDLATEEMDDELFIRGEEVETWRACPPLEAGALLLLLPGGINGTPLPLPAHVRQNLTSPES
uniref:Uncharacterized protein n=1 Tax=Oryza barthii TaxID=65489 RepID=A0A0D3F6D2_9ORYZ